MRERRAEESDGREWGRGVSVAKFVTLHVQWDLTVHDSLL